MISVGTALASAGAVPMLAYAPFGGTSPMAVTALFVPVNIGLGLRGPPGFYRALLAAHGDDARGSAIVILAIMAATATGTAVVAPFIEHGLGPVGLGNLGTRTRRVSVPAPAPAASGKLISRFGLERCQNAPPQRLL